jgi:heme exporter protein C
MQSTEKTFLSIGVLAFIALALAWTWALVFAPTELHMGEVYRIIYVHVPSAFTAFFSAYVLLLFSIMALKKTNGSAAPLWARSSAEIGLLFTVATLATGSIWGRPTWGVWWVWDARLTTTLILALLFAGYLVLYQSLNPGPQRTKICAVLGILIAADVPIIYTSVYWWRTLHQPPSLMRPGGSTIAPEMVWTLLACLAVTLFVAGWLLTGRTRNLRLLEELEKASYEQAS